MRYAFIFLLASWLPAFAANVQYCTTAPGVSPACFTVTVPDIVCPIAVPCPVCPGPAPCPAACPAGTTLSCVPVVPPPVVIPPVTTTADADFAARCAASGVVLCNGLDAPANLAAVPPGTGLAGDAGGVIRGSIDTTMKASGSGSLRFRLPPGGTLANIGGAWSGSLGKVFRSGDTLHLQWRSRFPSAYLSNNLTRWHSSMKLAMVHGPSSTCQSSEFTSILNDAPGPQANWPNLYTDCGVGFNANAKTGILCDVVSCPSDQILLQQGASLTDGYNCNYQNQFAGKGDGPGCFYVKSDIWYTFYMRVKLGTYGGSNTTVDGFVASAGGPYKQFQKASGIHWGGGDDNLALVRLETYMSELQRGGLASSVETFLWYDELIVSTQPIAAPNN